MLTTRSIVNSLKYANISIRSQSNLPKPFTNLVGQIRSSTPKQVKNYVRTKFNQINHAYDEIFGLSSLRKIQEAVVDAESMFVAANRRRRQALEELRRLHEELQVMREKIDASTRSSDIFLELITKEHALIKQEIQASNTLRQLEEQERDLFENLSKLVSRSHEFERMRQEKAKYISLLGSIIGALMGIIGTSLNHAYRVYNEKKRLSTFPMATESAHSNTNLTHDESYNQIHEEVKSISESINQVRTEMGSTNADWSRLEGLIDAQKDDQRKIVILCVIACLYMTALMTVGSFIQK